MYNEHITNWVALYIAIKHYDDDISIDKSVIMAENNKLPPIKRIDSLTHHDISLIIRKLSKLPSIPKIQRLVYKLQLSKENIVKIFLICKEVGLMVPDSITPEQVNEVIHKYKSGISILKIEEQTQLMLNSIFDILASKRLSKNIDVGLNYKEHDIMDSGVKKYKHVSNLMKTLEVGQIVLVKLNSGDKRVPSQKGKCKIIYKNNNYMTLEGLGSNKVTVTLSDIIEKKATVLKIKGEKVENG